MHNIQFAKIFEIILAKMPQKKGKWLSNWNSDHRDHPRNESRGNAEKHADEGAFDVEPVVVVIGGHVFGAGNDEMLVVAEPEAVQHDSVEPVHYIPEGIGR